MIEFAPILEGLGALVALFAWLGCALILFSYRSTLGALLAALVNALEGLNIGTYFGTIPIGSAIAAPLNAINNIILNGLGLAMSASEYAWHAWMHALASTLTWIGGAVAWDMHEVGKAFQAVVRHVVPRAIVQRVTTIVRPVTVRVEHAAATAAAGAIGVEAEALAAREAAKIAKLTAELSLPKAEAAATAAVAAATAIPLPRIGHIEHDVEAMKAWIKAKSKVLTGAGVVGLVAAALSELGLSSSRCSNNQKLSKGICGLSTKVLDDLLASLIAIVGTISLVELAEDYQPLFADVATETRTFWRYTMGSGGGGNPGLGQSGFVGALKVSNAGAGNPGLGQTGL